MIPTEISNAARSEAIASIQRYFDENLPEPIGTLPARMLLDFFLQEIAPAVYNQAITDAQGRIQQRVLDLSGELFSDEFQYWSKADAKKRR